MTDFLIIYFYISTIEDGFVFVFYFLEWFTLHDLVCQIKKIYIYIYIIYLFICFCGVLVLDKGRKWIK